MGTNNNLHAIKTALFTTDQIASDPDLALDVADLCPGAARLEQINAALR